MEENNKNYIIFLDDDDKYEKGDIICVSYFVRLLLYAWTHNPLGSPLALRLFDALPDPRAPIFLLQYLPCPAAFLILTTAPLHCLSLSHSLEDNPSIHPSPPPMLSCQELETDYFSKPSS